MTSFTARVLRPLDVALLSLVAASLLSASLAWLRAPLFGHAGLRWLPLNLVLAWVPLFLAFAAWRVQRTSLRIVAAGAALLFLPNAPYVITDVIHLRVLPDLPIWFDATLLWTTAFTSALVGALAMRLLEQCVVDQFGPASRWPFRIVVPILCAYGIHLGRFGRWNSWDVVAQPRRLVEGMLAATEAPFFLTFCAVFTLVAATSFLPFAMLPVERRRP